MRPGQNKRMRGRNSNNNNNRKGPNPLTRSYESNGPDVKIRGTAHHIGEKYLQLARDAQSSGDPVMAESYLQHAEHYFRLIAAAQQAQQQAQFGYQRQPGDQTEAEEDDADEDFVSLPDRFASPSERTPQPQQMPQPYADRQPYSDRQPAYEPRQDRQGQPDRQAYERQGQERQGQERQGQERQGQERLNQERSNQDRQDRYEPRPNNQDRNPQDRNPQDRSGGERPNYEGRERQYDNRRERNAYPDRGYPADRPNSDRAGSDPAPRAGQASDRPPREFDNRGFRNRNRDFRENAPRESREPRQPALDEPTNGLPAFITAPTRVSIEAEPQPSVVEAPDAPVEATDDASFHLRPRRRRRPKGEFASGESEGSSKTPETDPVGD